MDPPLAPGELRFTRTNGIYRCMYVMRCMCIMSVCLYVYVYVDVSIYIYVYMYVCMYAYQENPQVGLPMKKPANGILHMHVRTEVYVGAVVPHETPPPPKPPNRRVLSMSVFLGALGTPAPTSEGTQAVEDCWWRGALAWAQ